MTTEIGELTDRVKQNRKRKKINEVTAFPFGEEERQIVAREAEQADNSIYKVRPYRGEGGVREAITLLNGMHETAGSAETHAFEIVYANEILDFRFVPGSGIIGKNLRDQLFEDYPDSTVEQLTHPFPSLDDDQFIAGARMYFYKSTYYPIRHIDIDGFGDGNEGATRRSSSTRDPFKNILTKVTGGQPDVVMQVVFRPSEQGFWYRHKMQKVAKQMRAPNTRFLTDYEATDVEKQAAEIVENQQNESMYELEIRVLAAASTKQAAEGRVHSVVHALDEYYESHNRQGLYGKPVGNRTLRSDERDLRAFLRATASRSFEGYTTMKCTSSELAGIVHLCGEVNNPHIDYSESRAGIPVPIGTPRFEIGAAGLDETATPLEKQAAMFNASQPGEPYWIGTGARKGTEAGIHEEIFKRHVFAPGATGYGKTTLLWNLAYQFMKRGAGSLVYDPKGDDAETLLSIVPEEREDDVIYIELGGDRDRQVGFNFLEVPCEAPPDSPVYTESIEALADDLEALISLAGGEDDYWGPRMKRIVRNMVRGMAKAGFDCTLLDMYFALIDQDRRGQYAQMLEDERVEWIVEYAREHLADMDDSDLEPLIGRLQQWVENDITRELVSYPESTFSVEEAIREGKIIIVEDNTSSETVGTMVATALIRRIWVAVREQSRLGENPPMFYAILDEFDKIISANSNIATILSLARSKNLSIIGACQDLSNQLERKEQIQNAILGQCRTILNMNPQRPGEARLMAQRHSEDIDQQDLLNLGKYQVYMRTDNERGEPTKTYKVGTFPPIDEVEQIARPADETEALIDRSLEQYGGERRTTEDQKRDSRFYSPSAAGSDGELERSAAELDLSVDRQRNQALKAVYDESIRQGDPGGWVAVAACVDRLQRYLPGGEIVTDAGKAWRNVFQKVPDAYLDHSEVADEMQVRATDTGFMNVGESENDGTAEHWAPMADAYVPLTQLGFVVEIPAQTGDEMPDGLATLDDVLALDDVTDPETIADRVTTYRKEHPVLNRLAGAKAAYIEFEHTTGSTQPSQTVRNLTQAHTDGHRCLFVCREAVASKVYDTLAHEPACCRSSHPEAGERRFYTGTTTLAIDSETMTRPGAAENVWVHEQQSGQYVLRDSDGTEHARFDTPAEIFTDASAYPDGGDRNIKPPVIPEYELAGADIEAVDWDLIVVPEPATDETGTTDLLTPMDLKLYEGGDQISLTDLLATEKSRTAATKRATSPSAASGDDDPGDTQTDRAMSEEELRDGFRALTESRSE